VTTRHSVRVRSLGQVVGKTVLRANATANSLAHAQVTKNVAAVGVRQESVNLRPLEDFVVWRRNNSVSTNTFAVALID